MILILLIVLPTPITLTTIVTLDAFEANDILLRSYEGLHKRNSSRCKRALGVLGACCGSRRDYTREVASDDSSITGIKLFAVFARVRGISTIKSI